MTTLTPQPTAGAYSQRDARIDLAAAHRLAVLDELNEGTWNHFSLAVPGSPDEVLLSPPGIHWSRVKASDLVVVGPDRKRYRAEGGMLWTAYVVHYPIHRARPDAACVLHVHSPYATALAALKGGRLPMADSGAVYEFYGRVAYNDAWDGVDHGLAVGKRMAEALGDKKVLFLRNHGVVVTGPSVAQAYCDLYRLERTCRIQLIALSTGRELDEVTGEVAERFATEPAGEREYKRTYFETMKRLLDETQPDYAS